MRNIIVIADQDRGKSFLIKNEILPKFSARKNYIFDINKEYGKFKNEAANVFSKDEFLNFVPSERGSNANVVFEEASAFFSKTGSTSKGTIEHICRRFHSGNLNIFVFHALDQVPTDILYYIDFIVLFRTLDDVTKIQKTFAGRKKILSAFMKVRQRTENTRFDRVKKTYPDEYSRLHFHDKVFIEKPF